MTERENLFEAELNYIIDENIRNSAMTILNLLPEYFFHIPASSTGQYHPKYALGEGGLVRHTKAAIRIACELFRIYAFDDETKDLIILSLMIHDGIKKGMPEENHTKFEHPFLISNFIEENKDQLNLSDEQIMRVKSMVESHMGRFNTNPNIKDVVLPLPVNPEQKFVHLCDYLASRKCLELPFDNTGKII